MPKKPWAAGTVQVFKEKKIIRTVPFVYGATYMYVGKGHRNGHKCMLCFSFDFEKVPVIWESGESGVVAGEDLSYVLDPTPESFERSMAEVAPDVRKAIETIVIRDR